MKLLERVNTMNDMMGRPAHMAAAVLLGLALALAAPDVRAADEKAPDSAYAPPSAESKAPAVGDKVAKGDDKVPEGLLDLQELIRLIEIARESGFTEDEIKEITIEDHGRVIKALEYYNKVMEQRAQREKALKDRENRVYLTVDDILKELAAKEPADLKKLRDDLVTAK